MKLGTFTSLVTGRTWGQFPQGSMFLGEWGTHLFRGPHYWEHWGASMKGLCDWKDEGGVHLSTGRTGVCGRSLPVPWLLGDSYLTDPRYCRESAKEPPLLGGLGRGGSPSGPLLMGELGGGNPSNTPVTGKGQLLRRSSLLGGISSGIPVTGRTQTGGIS